MSHLKDIAQRVETIEVDGEKISLRLPPVIERNRLVVAGSKLDSEGDTEKILELDRIVTKALALCVVDQDDMEEDDWGRLITASRDRDIPGLADMVSRCLALCGFDSQVEDDESSDSVDEVIDGLGEFPTK